MIRRAIVGIAFVLGATLAPATVEAHDWYGGCYQGSNGIWYRQHWHHQSDGWHVLHWHLCSRQY